MAGSRKNNMKDRKNDGQETMENNSEERKKARAGESSGKPEELEKDLAEAREKYLRLFAEFENFKKRNTRERLELMRNAAQDTILAILPVLDDFDRARKSAEDESNDEYFSEGVELVYNKLYNTLRAQGLKEMTTTGEEFDAEIHEAITEVPAPSADMKGKIIDTVEKGYYLNDKIIRYPKVVVGK